MFTVQFPFVGKIKCKKSGNTVFNLIRAQVLIITSAHALIITSAHALIITSAYALIITSAYALIITSAHALIITSAYALIITSAYARYVHTCDMCTHASTKFCFGVVIAIFLYAS